MSFQLFLKLFFLTEQIFSKSTFFGRKIRHFLCLNGIWKALWTQILKLFKIVSKYFKYLRHTPHVSLQYFFKILNLQFSFPLRFHTGHAFNSSLHGPIWFNQSFVIPFLMTDTVKIKKRKFNIYVQVYIMV